MEQNVYDSSRAAPAACANVRIYFDNDPSICGGSSAPGDRFLQSGNKLGCCRLPANRRTHPLAKAAQIVRCDEARSPFRPRTKRPTFARLARPGRAARPLRASAARAEYHALA